MRERIGRSGLRRAELEQECAMIGSALGDVLKARTPGAGFALLLFDFGEKGNIAYVSNANREDMIEALGELLGNLKAETR